MIVSVIIPFYECKEWLREALLSVNNQDYKSIETIVINDGSKEDIGYIVEEFKDVFFYRIENSGPGTARNFGIEKAKGKYVAFLDSDDLWKSNKLSSQIRFMEFYSYKWSHTNYYRFSNDKDNLTKKIKCNIKGNITTKLFLYNPIATPCIIILRSILLNNKLLRFSDKIRIGEDSYFWFKMAELYPLGYLDEYLTMVRMRGTNAAQQAYLQIKSKSDTLSFLKMNKQLIPNKIYYYASIVGLTVCSINIKLIDKISLILKLSNSRREIISKFFYVLPYTYLKSISILIK